MGCETKNLAKIEVVTDTDVSYYHNGEIQGAFDMDELKNHIKAYGHHELCERLAFLSFQVWEAIREVNIEKSKEQPVNAGVSN